MLKRTMSVADKFKIFVNNLSEENQKAPARVLKTIALAMNDQYWHIKSDLKNVHPIGSYGRGTAIKGTRNVNLLLVLPPEVFLRADTWAGNGQMELLKELKQELIKVYPETVMKEEDKGQIIIPFQGGIEFEVIPGFLNPQGNYYYPNMSDEGSWNEFNPIKEIDIINEHNYKYAGKVKHLGKMMRAWKEVNNVPISGILLDTLILDFMDEWEGRHRSFQSYGIMTLDFFEFLAAKKDDKDHWYARGSNRKLQRTGLFGDMANLAYQKTCRAIDWEKSGDAKRANRCWQEIYGSYFPF